MDKEHARPLVGVDLGDLVDDLVRSAVQQCRAQLRDASGEEPDDGAVLTAASVALSAATHTAAMRAIRSGRQARAVADAVRAAAAVAVQNSETWDRTREQNAGN
ncbi:MAG: hypothetical protein JXB32_24925 [Deltaproteobacteria bacterium]|nr:hypothetical protein [Deltaproteobacteria bacterium]